MEHVLPGIFLSFQRKKEKKRLYPNEKRAIVKAEIVEEVGKERIIVASVGKA